MKGFAGKYDPVKEHLDAAFEMTVESPPRKRALRCSGLPYCGILDVVVPDEPEQADLSGALYMGIGTIMHTALQFYMSLGKHGANMWGSWKCSRCQKEVANSFRPPDCCNLPMLYVEVSLRIANMTGHVDYIAKYGNRWILLDFKTTAEDPGLPKRQHLLQVRHYIAMLKLQHGIQIDAYYIVYIGRGRPPKERWVKGPYNAHSSVPQTKDWMFRAISNYKAATQSRKNPSHENLVALVKTRPCHSVDDHEDYMSRKYEFERKPCPMLKYCSKGNRATYDAVIDLLDAGEAPQIGK